MPKNKRSYRKFIRINGLLLSKSFSRSKDAESWYLEMKRKKQLESSGIPMPFDLVSLESFAKEWLTQRKATNPKATWQMDETRLRKFILPFFRGRPFQRITSSEWSSLFNAIPEKFGLSFATRNRVRTLAGKLYSDAIKQGVASFNPISGIAKLKESSQTWSFLSASDSEKYLRAASLEESFFYAFAMTALNTGARVGEILALAWKDIHFESRRIHFYRIYEMSSQSIQQRTKWNSGRWLGINDALMTCLKEFKLECGKRSNLFEKPEFGHIDEGTLRRIHWRVCKKAGIRRIRMHDLRHTYASLFMMRGGSLYDLSSILGHRGIETTKRYAHLAPEHLQSKANLVSLSPSLNEGKIIAFPALNETTDTLVTHRNTDQKSEEMREGS